MQHWSALKEERLVGRRAYRRTRLRIDVEVKDSGGGWEPARLLELSVAGFRLELLPAMMRGRSLWLRVADVGPLPARVLWRDRAGVGCKFLYPISRDACEQIARVPGEAAG